MWRHPGISRLVTEGQHFITRASETIVSNHEWLTQASPGSPTGLSERVRRIAREMDPTRFHTEAPESRRTPACGEMDRVSTRPVNHETYYLDYVQDPKTWQEVMKMVDDVFRGSSQQQITLSPGHDIRKQVELLIPWRVERIQIAKTPRARRMPTDIPYTHRANILLYNDDDLAFESEDVGNVAFPRQRFSKGVRYAICVYGYAPQDPDEEQPVYDGPPDGHSLDDPEIPPEEVRGSGITMPNCKAPRDVKRAVARLHVNLGHPSSADLIRLISQQGTVNPETIAAAKALNCTSCLRMKNNAPPRPSRVVTKFMGQLGDNISKWTSSMPERWMDKTTPCSASWTRQQTYSR